MAWSVQQLRLDSKLSPTSLHLAPLLVLTRLCDCAGFGPQNLAVLAAYVLRQSLLVWLKTCKADIELVQNIDPTVGARAPSMSSRLNIERAAAAAIADTQAAGLPTFSPVAHLDVMLETDREGIMDSLAHSQLTPQRRSAINGGDTLLIGPDVFSRSQNGRETDSLVASRSPSSRSLQGPSFSSHAFPSFGANGMFDATSPPAQQFPASAGNYANHSTPHSSSNLSASSPTSPAGIPRPRRAPPPPPVAAVPPSPFVMISPFAQAYQPDAAAAFPPSDSDAVSNSIYGGSVNQEKRQTVRFAEEPAPLHVSNSRTYQHQDSGFTELAMARSGSSAAPNHSRSKSDLGQTSGRSSTQRSLSQSRSLSKQERAASITLEALDMPALPLPAEAGADATEEVLSPAISRQNSRQMSLLARQMSGFR